MNETSFTDSACLIASGRFRAVCDVSVRAAMRKQPESLQVSGGLMSEWLAAGFLKKALNF